ncbi:MAG: cold-shock protein [Terriglobia bacterium]
MHGIVKKLVRDRGFGFIQADDGQELFFHRSSLEGVNFDHLKEGAQVEFDLQTSQKGPRAANVREGSQ